MLKQLSDWFWNSNFWLPPGSDWDTFVTEDKTKNYRVFEDVYYYSVPFALAFITVRVILDRTLFQRLGEAFNVPEKPKGRIQPNEYLEEHYKRKSPIEVVMKKCDLDRSQVAHWLRKRREMDKPSTMYKFKESCWRATAYVFLVIVAIAEVWDKSWLTDLNNCWINYPRHEITPGIWWLYMLELGFYVSLLMTHAIDTKRKDAKQMCVHHLATIGLLLSSWANNMIRMGTLVLLVHDIADPLLETAKVFRYINWQGTCNTFFQLFALAFVVTRLILYPFFLMKSCMYDVVFILPWFNVYYAMNPLLVVLLCLHIFWGYLIYKVAAKQYTSGKVDDARSSSESSDNDDE